MRFFGFFAKCAFLIGITALLLPWQSSAHAGSIPERQLYAVTPDGVKVAIQEYGNPNGLEIVFIHGLDGSHLDWIKQVDSPLLRQNRLITYDLRGHGFSGKPSQPLYYTDGKRWGDELQTVIAATRLKHPVLVGWSLGGPIITNYLAIYGDAHIAGVVYDDGVIELKPNLIKPDLATDLNLASPDLGTYLKGTRQFVRKCFYRQPNQGSFALLYASAAMASPYMTKLLLTHGLSIPAATALPKVTVPVLYIYGEQDALVDEQTVERARALIPKLKVITYPETGHASFFERPEEFNHDLDRFTRQVNNMRHALQPPVSR